ncbi:type II toxin-antitoxin system VapC family toxin [Aquibium sp. A9E412]|uniref:type II toxin-antitoxin system VapC family toxin n=1 Tax=Aquibium sp. A9E412 TaxID=2976767 RepID=UPI0025B1C7F0|nr:type II toxin-antitoxin system VapC family toxin [Aquibium sp. A9E412]MDN2567333.1 type II toxin-antitoxin system VapC family toxin [Aquibium sp. A9E412]
MPTACLYIDANVFIAMVERSGRESEALIDLFRAGRRQDRISFVTSELSIAEVLVKPLRDRDESLTELYLQWIGPSAGVEPQPVDRETLISAADLRAASPALKLPDTIHLATAMRCRCSSALTFDKRWSAAAPLLKECRLIEPEGDALTELAAELSQ